MQNLIKFVWLLNTSYTVYPKKYAHGFCFAMLCCGYTLTDLPISIRLTSLALWQSDDCPSASEATLMNMDKYFIWIHYERLHNHNKAKHNKTVCIFLGIYCKPEVTVSMTAVASFTKDVIQRLAKRPLKTSGRVANRGLTSLVKEATSVLKLPSDDVRDRYMYIKCGVFFYEMSVKWNGDFKSKFDSWKIDLFSFKIIVGNIYSKEIFMCVCFCKKW